MKSILAAAVAAAALFAAPVQAAEQIDINNLVVGPPSSGNGAGANSLGMLQTFTMQTSGQLTRIDIFGHQYGGEVAFGTLHFDFFDISALAPGAPLGFAPGTALGSLLIPLSTVGTYTTTSYDLSGLNLVATAGTRLALRMLVTMSCACGDANFVTWNTHGDGSNSNNYAGGALYAWNGVSAYGEIGGRDLNFRTWVDASVAVPEPGTWAMMIGGFGLVGAGMRRRNGRRLAAA